MTYQVIAVLAIGVAALVLYCFRHARKIDRCAVDEMDKAHNGARHERFKVGDRFECEEL